MVHLSRLFSISIIAILPWLFEKLMVDHHLSTDMILLTFQNIIRQEQDKVSKEAESGEVSKDDALLLQLSKMNAVEHYQVKLL